MTCNFSFAAVIEVGDHPASIPRVAGGFVSQILILISNAAFDDSEFDTAVTYVRINGVIEIASIAAAVMALLIVKQITERQQQRAARFGFQLN